jgi:alkylhydroperoxidase/carboxymuconolactone decarboxylase family protein YurZ
MDFRQEGEKGTGIYHVVISNATMISSLRMRAVNDIDTICRNSFSNRTRDMIIIAAPVAIGVQLALVDADHQPLEKCLVR